MKDEIIVERNTLVNKYFREFDITYLELEDLLGSPSGTYEDEDKGYPISATWYVWFKDIPLVVQNYKEPRYEDEMVKRGPVQFIEKWVVSGFKKWEQQIKECAEYIEKNRTGKRFPVVNKEKLMKRIMDCENPQTLFELEKFFSQCRWENS